MENRNEKVIDLYAPIKGKSIKIEEVPDPVFSKKITGEGIAIIPNKEKVILKSPCEAMVGYIHEAKHAFILTREDDTEVLIHIGLDTVELQGRPFKMLVGSNEKVTQGQPLVEIDVEAIMAEGKNVHTMITIPTFNPVDDQILFFESKGNEVSVGDIIFSYVKLTNT